MILVILVLNLGTLFAVDRPIQPGQVSLRNTVLGAYKAINELKTKVMVRQLVLEQKTGKLLEKLAT